MMQLREFTLISPTLEAKQVFKVIESAISIESIQTESPKVSVKANGNGSCRLIWWCAW